MELTPLENIIQKWIEDLAKGSGSGAKSLASVLRYEEDSLSQAMSNRVSMCRLDNQLARNWHRSINEACRVLQSLVEPRFRFANQNISKRQGEQLRPDLVLEDEISSAYVVVEIKRSKQAAREFATELLAYANCLRQQSPGSKVFFVLISTTWASIERYAISELSQLNIPVLPLEYRALDPGETGATLRVRSDLLPAESDALFSEMALKVWTKTFYVPATWNQSQNSFLWINRIKHTVAEILREAEKTGASGFIIVWTTPNDRIYQGVSRLYFSMSVQSPDRTDRKLRKNASDVADEIPWDKYDDDPIEDDTALRLLLRLNIFKEVLSDSPENEGTWVKLRERLDNEDAEVVFFDSYGEIGDQVCKWRIEKRYAFECIIPDIAALPSYHPLTWLMALQSKFKCSVNASDDPIAWSAYRRGLDMGGFRGEEMVNIRDSHFGRALSQARFIYAWCVYFASEPNAPSLELSSNGYTTTCDWQHIQCAINFARERTAKKGPLAEYCFELGYQSSLLCRGSMETLVKKRDILRGQGLSLPPALDDHVDSFGSY